MKYLLIFTIFNSEPFSYDTLRYETESYISCQKEGHALAKDLLSKIPSISHTRFECVEREYGR